VIRPESAKQGTAYKLTSRYLLNVFCCPLLVQVSGAQFSWLERLPVTQEVEGSSPVAPAKFRNYFWQEIGIG
jgi:hypothetical protein